MGRAETLPDPRKPPLVVTEGTNGHRQPILAPLERRFFVDLNYLFHRQEVEKSRSETAECEQARTVHEELAKRYEEQIETATGDDFRFQNEE